MLDVERLEGESRQQIAEALALANAGEASAAVAILEAVRDRLRPISPQLAIQVGVELASIYEKNGWRSLALDTLADEAEAARAPELSAVRARILMQAAPLHPSAETALRMAGEADRLASLMPDPRPRLQTLATMLQLLAREGRHDVLPAVADVLAQQARLVGSREVEAEAHAIRAEGLLAAGKDVDALEAARQAHALALVAGVPDVRARAAAVRGLAARRRGELLEALECLDQAMLEDADFPHELRLERALAATGLGVDRARVQQDLADLAIDEDAQLARRARLAQANIAIDAGDSATAEAIVANLTDANDRLAMAARLDLLAGRASDAVAKLRELQLHDNSDTGVRLQLAHAQLLAGQAVPALTELDGLVAQASAARDVWLELQARLARSTVLEQLGDGEAARQDARRAAELAATLHLPVQHAQARALVALGLARLELFDEAQAEIEEALAFAARMGAETTSLRLTVLRALLDTAPTRASAAVQDLEQMADRVAEVVEPGLVVMALHALASRALEHDRDLETAIHLHAVAAHVDAQQGGRHAARLAAFGRRLGMAEAT